MVAQTKKTKKELKAERRALMQDADSVINKDDLIGRVVIDLCRTHPNTVYDSWFELRRSKTIDDKGKFGAVRVRYSLEWNTPERRRLLAYISPPPLFVTHIESRNIVDGINQIVYGDTKPDVDDKKFSLDRFKSHAREFKSHMMDGVYAASSAAQQQHCPIHPTHTPFPPLPPIPQLLCDRGDRRRDHVPVPITLPMLLYIMAACMHAPRIITILLSLSPPRGTTRDV